MTDKKGDYQVSPLQLLGSRSSIAAEETAAVLRHGHVQESDFGRQYLHVTSGCSRLLTCLKVVQTCSAGGLLLP